MPIRELESESRKGNPCLIVKVRRLHHLLECVLAIILVGCSAHGPAWQEAQLPASRSVIYVYRPYAFAGSALRPTVNCGEGPGIALSPGGYHLFVVEAGSVACEAQSIASSAVTIKVEAGQQYYVREELDWGLVVGGPRLFVVGQDIGRSEIQECKLEGSPELATANQSVPSELASTANLGRVSSEETKLSPEVQVPKPAPTGEGEKRIALVIGNSTYKYVTRLSNPSNDARLMAETLKRDGFVLVGGHAQIDLDKSAFDNAVQNFGNQLPRATIALFYYAGHGVQVNGANYLIPISANPTKESDVDFQMVDAQTVLHQMQDGGARLNVLILDACRNNPFGGRGLRSAAGGLAQMQAPEGTLISYTTQPGNVASDGDDKHSPYAKALAQALREPGLDVFRVFNEVGLIVKRHTQGAQEPWISSSPIEGNFYFAGAPTQM